MPTQNLIAVPPVFGVTRDNKTPGTGIANSEEDERCFGAIIFPVTGSLGGDWGLADPTLVKSWFVPEADLPRNDDGWRTYAFQVDFSQAPPPTTAVMFLMLHTAGFQGPIGAMVLRTARFLLKRVTFNLFAAPRPPVVVHVISLGHQKEPLPPSVVQAINAAIAGQQQRPLSSSVLLK